MTRDHSTSLHAPADAEQGAPTVLHGGGRRLPVRWINRESSPITISRYCIDPGAEVSLHVHTGKLEYWLILAGAGIVRVGSDIFAVAEGDIIATEPTVPHALQNTGSVQLLFVNIVQATGGPITTTDLTGI